VRNLSGSAAAATPVCPAMKPLRNLNASLEVAGVQRYVVLHTAHHKAGLQNDADTVRAFSRHIVTSW
jgi:hypothetical protein